MAETFICKGGQVHFTNGGCHELYLAWSKCAENLQYCDLAVRLRAQTNQGWGCAADGIDEEYLSNTFCTKDIKIQWLKVMDLLLDEIKLYGAIAESMEVSWDDELRSYWFEKLNKLREALYMQVNA